MIHTLDSRHVTLLLLTGALALALGGCGSKKHKSPRGVAGSTAGGATSGGSGGESRFPPLP